MTDLEPSEGVAIFTDGSCNSGNRYGGWAYVAVDAFGNTYHDSGFMTNTTINQMELHAPRMGLEALRKTFGRIDVLIYSDSQYVVKGFNDPSRARNTNHEFWDALEAAAKYHTYVEMNYIPGHRSNGSNLYNALADKMAGEARLSGQNGKKR